MVDGSPTTEVTQTVLDCSRSLDFEAAVVIADASLHRKLTTTADLETALGAAGFRRASARPEAVRWELVCWG
ncbi:MAG: hypothetical protein ABIR83_09430 [Nakamurella sp.]